MPHLVLLTVGTGTAGKTSNLASGLRTTLAQLAPRRYWLAPSSAEDSRLMAELVRENDPAFAPVSSQDPYFSLSEPDNLETCRQDLRSAIAAIRAELRPGERLIVNPTSGTKQMTAAAVLAALDEGIGDIVFTTGQRADGVVITGTEQLTAFDSSGYFREHDLKTARDLFSAGAFNAAARVIKPHGSALAKAHATALACHHWERFDYAKAAACAATGREDLRSLFAGRARSAASGIPCPEILSDLLIWAAHYARLQDAGACLATAYKALEFAARLRFHTLTGLVLPCHHQQLAGLNLPEEWLERSYENRRDDGIVAPGLWQVMSALQHLQDPFGEAFFQDSSIRRLTFARNATVHDISPPSPADAQSMLVRVRNLISSTLPPLPPGDIPHGLPE